MLKGADCHAERLIDVTLEKKGQAMLVLTRKNRESVVIARPDDLEIVLEITILEIEGGRVRLGFQADTKLPIHGKEVWDRICNGGSTNGEAVRHRTYAPLGTTHNGEVDDDNKPSGQKQAALPPLQEAMRLAALRAAAMRATTTVDGC